MNARRDQNYRPTIIGVLESDGETVTAIVANPSNHALGVDDDTTGSDNGPTEAKRDENYVTTLMAVSSADGVTPVPLYVTAAGLLLVDSN